MIGSSEKHSGRRFLSRPRLFPASAMDLIVCLWVILAITHVITAENNFYTQGRYGKREELHQLAGDSPAYFKLSRHSQSGTKSAGPSNTGSKSNEISPRADRFFLGSRYGKRALAENAGMSGGKRLALLGRLDAILRYLERVRRSNQHRSPLNYEIEQIYYDNGNGDNGIRDNDSQTLSQFDNNQW